jgi:hypothetical protein
MYRDVALSTYIHLKKLMWAGHIVKKEHHHHAKEGTRKLFWSRKASG